MSSSGFLLFLCASMQVSYVIWGDEVLASCLTRPPAGQVGQPEKGVRVHEDGTGDFLVMVSPTRPADTQPWSRSIVFVVDRSGSMQGDPIEAARTSIKEGALLSCLPA